MIGTLLDGKYRIVRRLGEGGMGAVYEAEHAGTGRRVAVKVITAALAQNEGPLARFEREARAAGAIDSAHIAQVLDSGKDAATGLPYLVMELLTGQDLNQLLQKGPIAPDLALRILAQACLGLTKAHGARVMHRDLKPANLFLARRDEGEITVKILDFGIAKIKLDDTGGSGGNELTRTSSLLGSPLYMSPEQARGLKDIDYRTDLWSLGVLLYKMLSGRTPHEDIDAIGELILSICSVPAPPIQGFAPWVAPEVAAIAHRALRVNRAERFQRASDMLDAIRPLLDGSFVIRESMLVPLSAETRARTAPVLTISTQGTEEQGPPVRWTQAFPPQQAEALAAAITIDAASVKALLAAASPDTTKDSTARPAVTEVRAPESVAPSPVAKRSRAMPIAVAATAAIALSLAGAFAIGNRGHHETAPAAVSSSAPVAPPGAAVQIDPERLASFGVLPSVVTSPSNPMNEEKIKLGKMLFFDARLSKNHDLSCNSCHRLDAYGADGEKVSTGHAHRRGTRNVPSIYNAAGYFALAWDGSAPNLEEQSKRPMLRPNEMAMTEQRVEATLRSMHEYVAAFSKAFPNEPTPLSFANAAKAIGAFGRTLFTPSRWDTFLAGEPSALTDAEKAGFNDFVDAGCVSCHFGPYVGATMFQKVGLVKAWPNTMDRGRFEITQNQVDYMVFRVPSLRNVAVTAPYFHDGSISSLDEAIRLMARHQLGKELTPQAVASIATWLKCLTGTIPREAIEKPILPESSPTTPKPEPG